MQELTLIYAPVLWAPIVHATLVCTAPATPHLSLTTVCMCSAACMCACVVCCSCGV